MTNRITQKDLNAAVERLNRTLGRELATYTKTDTGYTPNAGVYHIDSAYGGFRLCAMSNTKGCTGSRDISPRGTRREVYEYIHAMLTGIRELEDSKNH